MSRCRPPPLLCPFLFLLLCFASPLTPFSPISFFVEGGKGAQDGRRRAQGTCNLTHLPRGPASPPESDDSHQRMRGTATLIALSSVGKRRLSETVFSPYLFPASGYGGQTVFSRSGSKRKQHFGFPVEIVCEKIKKVGAYVHAFCGTAPTLLGHIGRWPLKLKIPKDASLHATRRRRRSGPGQILFWLLRKRRARDIKKYDCFQQT